jgi:flagellar biosynthesis/type III secretory pathway protein FliH
VADETLNAGDITIESRNGYFDARIEQRLRLLEERMKERYQHDHRARTET